MKLNDKRILVTGGAGFIGSHLAELLVDQGAKVTVFDNFCNGSYENLASIRHFPSFNIIEADITDSKAVYEACKNSDVVFHLACLGVRHSLHSPVENHHVNASGTLTVLEAAKVARVQRFIYVSTSEIYGRAVRFPISEDDVPHPLTVYGASKLAGEHYSRAFFECFGLPVICIRPFNNYGPRSHFEGDSGEVIPRFILRVLSGQAPIIFGDGMQTRDFLYVKDCVCGLAEIASHDDLVGQVVNLGANSEVSVKNLANSILHLLGRSDLQPLYEPPRPADVPRLLGDFSKLHRCTSFTTKVALTDGLKSTIDYFQKLSLQDPSALKLRELSSKNW